MDNDKKDNNNEQGYKVYYDGDDNWYATKWTEEKTAEWIQHEYGLGYDEIYLEECNLDEDGMWYETVKEEDIKELGEADETCKGGLGDLRRGIEDNSVVEKLTSFREVIKIICSHNGDGYETGNEEPFVIATTNY